MKPATAIALALGDLCNAVISETPGGIEAQEAAGQADLARASVLPKDCNASQEQLERIGFKFHPLEDALFRRVDLPEGWSLKPDTESSYWTYILDANGVERASVFYKAALYDRKAHAYFIPRYTQKSRRKATVHVVDNQTSAVLQDFGATEDFHEESAKEKQAQAWLEQNFPLHRDVTAYWS